MLSKKPCFFKKILSQHPCFADAACNPGNGVLFRRGYLPGLEVRLYSVSTMSNMIFLVRMRLDVGATTSRSIRRNLLHTRVNVDSFRVIETYIHSFTSHTYIPKTIVLCRAIVVQLVKHWCCWFCYEIHACIYRYIHKYVHIDHTHTHIIQILDTYTHIIQSYRSYKHTCMHL
jgi:hypothetical protein